MSPYETRPIPRQPLAALPIEPFLVRVNSSSSPRKPKPTLPLQLRDMSLLPSPFLTASTSAAATAVQQRPEPRPLATLYEAAPSRDATSGPRSSPKARLMMQEDDTQAQVSNKDATERADDDDDDEQDALALGSSPRRLYDAFVAVASRPAAAAEPSPRPRKKTSTSSLSAAHFVAERSHMMPPPPPSPRRTGSPRRARAVLRADDEPPPNWSFYQDDDDDDVSMSSATVNDGSGPSPAASSVDIDSSAQTMPIDKENTAPVRPEARSRSSSLLATLTNPTTAPAAPGAPSASVPTSTTPTRPPPTSTMNAAAAPCTPPRPISPPLPLLSPPLLAAVEAPSSASGDTNATNFFVSAQLGSADVDVAGQESALLPPTMDAEGTGEAPRKKRRSDEAGRSIAID